MGSPGCKNISQCRLYSKLREFKFDSLVRHLPVSLNKSSLKRTSRKLIATQDIIFYTKVLLVFAICIALPEIASKKIDLQTYGVRVRHLGLCSRPSATRTAKSGGDISNLNIFLLSVK